MLWLSVQRRQMCTEGPWDRAGLCSIAGGAGEGEAGSWCRQDGFSPPMPCETSGNSVIVYSSCGMWDGSMNQDFTMAYLSGPCFGMTEV